MPSHTEAERLKRKGPNTHNAGPTGGAVPGIEAILTALQTGGQPIGQIGRENQGINPSEAQMPTTLPRGLPGQAAPAQPNPSQAALDPATLEQIQTILQALLTGGAGGFNSGGTPVG